jgi:hypothetical protein
VIDIVIPLGNGSTWHDNELKYCLRSIEKYLTGFRDIHIVGACPKFLRNINHIPCRDIDRIPDTNIMRKLNAACENPQVSDNFLMFNDDHFLVHNFHAPDFPYLYFKDLSDYIALNRGPYAGRARSTKSYLEQKGLSTKYFDIHTPIIYNKAKFMENVVEKWHPSGFLIKSMYANSLKIEGEPEPDYKISTPKEANGARVLSTYPQVPHLVRTLLLNLYPEKSTFER